MCHTLYNLSNPAHILMKTFIDAERQAIAKVWIERGFRLGPIPPTRAPTRPSKTLLQGFEYIPAAKTDIRQSWVKAGWIPIERKPHNDIQTNPTDSP